MLFLSLQESSRSAHYRIMGWATILALCTIGLKSSTAFPADEEKQKAEKPDKTKDQDDGLTPSERAAGVKIIRERVAPTVIVQEEVISDAVYRTRVRDDGSVEIVKSTPIIRRTERIPAAYEERLRTVLPAPDEAKQSVIWTDAKVQEQYKEWVIDAYKHEIEVRKANAATMVDTNFKGAVIFWVVHVLLAVAVLISIVQVCRSFKLHRGKQDDKETELKVSSSGFAFKTSLTGVILLAFALAFYFLYIKFVWPITLIG